MPYRVSIIICTRDRAESLRATLASLARCEVPTQWNVEVIVVDNGSSDHTPSVIRDALQGSAPVVGLLEPRRGQAIARNLGVNYSQADVVLFTDDDVRVEPSWIRMMAQPLINGDADLVQGRVIPTPDRRRPWMKGMLSTWVAIVESPNACPPGVVGANMGFRREVFDQVGSFDEQLGPGALGFFDDTLFAWRAERLGFRKAYVPESVVEHHFDMGRMSPEGILRIAERMAASKAYVLHHWEHAPTDGLGPIWKSVVAASALRPLAWARWRLWRSLDERYVFHRYRLALCKAFDELAGAPRRYERCGGPVAPARP